LHRKLDGFRGQPNRFEKREESLFVTGNETKFPCFSALIQITVLTELSKLPWEKLSVKKMQEKIKQEGKEINIGI
jgi:hypothetical protein